MDEALYLHEVIDIVGSGAWPYMRHTRDAAGNEKVNFRLQGTWYVMGITGRWPQVVNVWDIPGGWDGWGEAVERLNLQRTSNKELERWWAKAYEMRTGGFDRLLRGADASPLTEDLVARGVRGALFMHEVAEVRPGAAVEYLAAAAEVRAPLLAEYGHTVTGLYEVMMTENEAVTMWATSTAAHVGLMRAMSDGDDSRLAKWRDTARQFVVRSREELMTPCPGTPLGPPIAIEDEGDNDGE